MLRRLLFWLFIPFVIPQALLVRKNARRFAIAQGPKMGSVGSGPVLNMLAIGDSVIAGVGAGTLSDALVGQAANAVANANSCSVHWRACGRNGATSHDAVEKLLPMLPSEAIDVFIVSVGVNDVTSLTSSTIWTRNLTVLLSELHRHSSNAAIAVIGLPPLTSFPLLPWPLRSVLGMRANYFDQLAKQTVANHKNAVYIPLTFSLGPEQFSSDGFHPSESSYRELGEVTALAIASYIERKLEGALADNRPQ